MVCSFICEHNFSPKEISHYKSKCFVAVAVFPPVNTLAHSILCQEVLGNSRVSWDFIDTSVVDHLLMANKNKTVTQLQQIVTPWWESMRLSGQSSEKTTNLKPTYGHKQLSKMHQVEKKTNSFKSSFLRPILILFTIVMFCFPSCSLTWAL